MYFYLVVRQEICTPFTFSAVRVNDYHQLRKTQTEKAVAVFLKIFKAYSIIKFTNYASVIDKLYLQKSAAKYELYMFADLFCKNYFLRIMSVKRDNIGYV